MEDKIGIFDVNSWNYLMANKISLNILLPIILNFGRNKVWTSLYDLKRITGFSDQTVRQRLDKMRNFNLIIRTRRNRGFYYAPTHELTEEMGDITTLPVFDFFNKLFKFLKSSSSKRRV